MREPPRLAETLIRTMVQEHYALPISALTFLPIGNDLASSVYRVETSEGQAYFLKVRVRGGFSPASLIVPRYLADQGVPHVLAPLLTRTQTLWVDLDDFALSLYPYLETRTATDAGLSETQWRAFGAMMKQIHTQRLTPDIEHSLRPETFIPSRRNILTELEPVLTQSKFANPAERDLADFWRSQQAEIQRVLEQADALGQQLRQTSKPLVICHADLHTWNVLVDSQNQFWVVDWDEVILAPKERDLMFVIGGIGRDLVSESETAWFLEGYGGNAGIDQKALVYYRYAWATQDMGAYAEQVFLTPEASDSARREGVDGFKSLFEPGNIVSIAFEAD